MKELLLDARTIIEDPRVLGLISEDYNLITTPLVLESIRRSGNMSNISYDERLTLIENAVKKEILFIAPSSNYEIELIEYSITNFRLTITEKNILAYILYCRKNQQNISLVTKSKTLQKAAATYKINIFPLKELDVLLDSIPKQNYQSDNIIAQIEEYERKERKKILIGLTIGAILSYLAFKIYYNINTILASTNVWGTIALIIILSFTLYIIREKWRLPYGFLEFSIGVFSVIINFYPSKFNFTIIPFDSSFFIKVIGGIYIMVRGIDNVMNALNDTKFGILFRNLLSLRK
ncbi:hypothetical protein BH11BAC3_BH11BAC3_08180 [soil metagenome]